MNEKPATDDATAASSSGQANDVAHAGPCADAPDADNPQWTDADFARARPVAEALPPEVFAALVEAGQVREPAPEPSVLPQYDATATAGLQPTPEEMNAPLDDNDAPELTEELLAGGTWLAHGRPTTREHATQVLRDRLDAGTARQRTPERQQLDPTAAVSLLEPPAGEPLRAPASGSAWIDPDDAPPFTDEDFERGTWTRGDQVITRAEGEVAFRAIAAAANARRRTSPPPDGDDK